MIFTVEHTTYRHGDKQEDETDCATEQEALDLAKHLLHQYGGRVWVNNQEYSRKDFI